MNRTFNYNRYMNPSRWSAGVRIMVALPAVTTFLVLSLGLAVMQIGQQTLMTPQEVTAANIDASLCAMVAAVLVVAAAALMAGTGLAAYIVRPLNRLTEDAENVARGDLSGMVRLRGAVAAHPEFAELVRALDSMMASLNDVFLKGVNCGIVTVDSSGRITFVNQAAAEMLGCESADITGRLLADSRLGAHANGAIFNIVRKTLDTSEPAEPREVELNTHFGSAVTVKASTALFRDDSAGAVGVSLRIEDLTSVHKLRSEMQKLERFTAFSGFVEGVAHQVRNPLCSIRGYAQLIKENLDGQDGVPDEIIQNADMIDDVIRSFLDASMNDNSLPGGDYSSHIHSTLLPNRD